MIDGVKLSRSQSAAVGHLQWQRHAVGSRNPDALLADVLKDDGSSLVPPLHDARVRRITREGLVITGTEIVGKDTAKARVRSFPQVWWCVLQSDTALRFLAGTYLTIKGNQPPSP
jgi:hypothetical protein